MSSSSGPAPAPSGGQVSVRFWNFGIESAPDPSANFDVLTGGLIDELEWVRTGLALLNGWNFVNHAAQRATPNAIENSAVLPARRGQN
jgi:hypothetical protein